MPQEILYSTCRHCRQPVVFKFLPPMPEDRAAKTKFRARYRIWYHRNRRLGDELHCVGTQVRALPRDYCVESITSADAWSFSGRTCNRPVKDFDLFMCGIHARHKREREERDRKYREKRDISDYIFSQTLELQKEIQDRFGIQTKTHYNWKTHEYDGLVTVNPRELLDLLEGMLLNSETEELEFEDFV